MTVNLANADVYLNKQLDNEAWTTADANRKQNALDAATEFLTLWYPGRALPDNAVYQQSLWMLQGADDTMRLANQGVQSQGVSGVVSTSFGYRPKIPPIVRRLIGGRMGATSK